MEHHASFGQWLVQRRHSLHVQRGELAARIGCAVVTLRKIEADERRPSRQLAARLADHLAIAPGERERFVRAARGELPIDRLAIRKPKRATPTNLPAPTTTLAGREREIADIAALLGRADVRLLTLTGAPGVGKTRVALDVASTRRRAFADGVFFADLAPLTIPDLVPQAIAHALHGGLSGGRALHERLGRYLRSRQVLLVVDTFEHVRGATPLLAQLLAAAPQLKLLITSRVALEVSGEHRFTLLPLDVPPAAAAQHSPSAEEIQARYPAIDLFVQRARAVMPSWTLTGENMQAVSEICRRLDGLPLAIELAAANVALFTPQEVLARMDDRWALLRSGARESSARHTTLWRTLDWSYELLSPTEQLLLRRLSVFVGGCTVEEVEQVCNSDGAVGHDVVDGIAALLAASLLQRYEGNDGRSRFTMLKTVHGYARQQLAANGEESMLRQRHAAYYLQLAQAAEGEWHGAQEWAWLRRLVEVRPNLWAVLHRALDTHDTALALQLGGALFPWWIMAVPLPDARGWLDAALALARSSPAPNLAAAEGKMLNVAGHVAMEMSDYVQAYTYFERGLRLYRALNDARGSAWSLRGCALVHLQRNEYAAAERLLRKSLQLCRETGDAWGEAWSLYLLGVLRLAQRDWVEAQHALENALGCLHHHYSMFGVFHTLLALAHTCFEQGDLPAAAARCGEALALRRQAPLLTFLAVAIEEMAIITAAQGFPLQAARWWGAAAALREATGEERWPLFQQAYDRALASARKEVGEAEWSAAWAAGSALSAPEAVDEALAGAEQALCVGA